ncbi:MAG: acetylglutamate kinase [Bacteroidales bacterium]|nr:acetylglutamate kinase [Bacteroidales bacterium]MBO5718502.1 acetylglutamate kinase [Bacteroidales bacterium]MBO5818468.1 acetylglutamate kinase [Bacteroidales bacterium]MBO5846015.1 acetylglutamate kinase [Bacteroidales bacterium]MBO7182710.1 acetylglutamate kinase [Bacteroidales bacterium]
MNKLSLIKVGGKVVENPETLAKLLNDFKQIAGYKILVHGGGKLATELSQKMGIETKMVEGRRITDRETLEVVTMVYAGLVNKNIVAQLQALHINAMGLCGADFNLIRSSKRPVKDIDYGFVGDVQEVQGDVLADLINQNIVPVVAPITHDRQGQLLNTNADTVANELAKAMAPHFDVHLYYCFEKPGVLMNPDDDNSLIREIKRKEFEQYKEEGIIQGGMIPKLDNAFNALACGVKEVIITQADRLLSGGGTHIIV